MSTMRKLKVFFILVAGYFVLPLVGSVAYDRFIKPSIDSWNETERSSGYSYGQPHGYDSSDYS